MGTLERIADALEGIRAILAHMAEGVATGTPPAAAPPTAPDPATEGGGTADVNAMPKARELAEEHGVDLTQVQGSGKGGRITKADVQGFIDAQAAGDGGEESGDETPDPDAAKAAVEGASKAQREPDASIDDVRTALRRLMTTFEDMDAARKAVTEILGNYGATSVANLEAQHYDDVVERARQKAVEREDDPLA